MCPLKAARVANPSFFASFHLQRFLSWALSHSTFPARKSRGNMFCPPRGAKVLLLLLLCFFFRLAAPGGVTSASPTLRSYGHSPLFLMSRLSPPPPQLAAPPPPPAAPPPRRYVDAHLNSGSGPVIEKTALAVGWPVEKRGAVERREASVRSYSCHICRGTVAAEIKVPLRTRSYSFLFLDPRVGLDVT